MQAAGSSEKFNTWERAAADGLPAPLQVLARDFVLAACKLGYGGKIVSKHEPAGKRRIDCSKFTASSTLTKGSSKYLLRIEDFKWPSGATGRRTLRAPASPR